MNDLLKGLLSPDDDGRAFADAVLLRAAGALHRRRATAEAAGSQAWAWLAAWARPWDHRGDRRLGAGHRPSRPAARRAGEHGAAEPHGGPDGRQHGDGVRPRRNLGELGSTDVQ